MLCRQACSTSYSSAAAAPRRTPPVHSRAPRRAAAAAAAAAPHSAAGGAMHPDPSQPVYPGFQEERDVSHEAFMHAFEAARPRAMSIPGMQEFAASLWNRRRSIPSSTYSDPLDHIFTEFDTDNDGKLTAEEVAKALISRGVDATAAQVQMFIEASDTDSDHLICRSEFASFIFHMASADLRSATSFAQGPAGPGAAAAAGPAAGGGAGPVLILPPRPPGL